MFSLFLFSVIPAAPRTSIGIAGGHQKLQSHAVTVYVLCVYRLYQGNPAVSMERQRFLCNVLFVFVSCDTGYTKDTRKYCVDIRSFWAMLSLFMFFVYRLHQRNPAVSMGQWRLQRLRQIRPGSQHVVSLDRLLCYAERHVRLH